MLDQKQNTPHLLTILIEIHVNTYIQSRTKKVGQCFFANVNLLALSMVTMKIFIYLLY
jgi:hypothetical protein